MRLAVDIEANDLWPKVSKVHCLVAVDVDTGDAYKYGPDEIEMGLGMIDGHATEIILHNGLGYDLKVLDKLYIWKPKCKVTDTLVLSRLYNPDLVGGHSLDAWGQRLAKNKGYYARRMVEQGLDPWAEFNQSMMDYCTLDAQITVDVYKYLVDKLKEFGEKSIKLEELVARMIEQQADTGVYFDIDKADRMVNEMDRRCDEIYKEVRPHLVVEREVGNPFKVVFKVNGDYRSYVQDYVDETGINVAGPFTRIAWVEPNIGSRQKMAKQLIRLGWKPTSYTDKGNPQITFKGADGDIKPCPNLAKMLGDLGDKIAEYYVTRHRQAQIKGWISNTREDHRIPAGAISNGTNTARMQHRVVANVPRVTSMYGKEMRSLFIATPGKVMVGVDLAGLELRCLAHYMNDPDYTDLILNGDIHTYNQELAGLPTRDNAKTFIYGFL